MLKSLLAANIPIYSFDVLFCNLQAPCLHMQFLRKAQQTGDIIWFKRAIQHGQRHQSFPLLFDWNQLSSELKKFVVYRFVKFTPGSSNGASSFSLFPCSITDLVDYMEWLPHAGVRGGWTTLRHYFGQLKRFSHICGFGDIVSEDADGFDTWRENFAANVRVIRQPRGGDLPLRPWYLRRLAPVYSSGSDFDTLMLMMISLMWFTALRVCHFSPGSSGDEHMIQWEFIASYRSSSLGSSRNVLHFEVPTAKTRQEQDSVNWSTATCCICESYDCTEDEHADLTALCPVCATERWRRRFPWQDIDEKYSRFLCVRPDTKEPFERSAFNKELRRALDLALAYLSATERALIIKQLSAKSWRSGAATQIVTGGNAGFVAAAFLGHTDLKTTQRYYHQGGDEERLQVAPALAEELL